MGPSGPFTAARRVHAASRSDNDVTTRRVCRTQRHRSCKFTAMTPLPSEPPEVVLDKMIALYRVPLGRIRYCLDWAIQAECAAWKKKHPGRQLTEVNPNVLAGDIRQSVSFVYEDAYPSIDGIRLRRGANCSIGMVGNGGDAPIRKHPRKRSGFLLAVTTYPSDTLFGEDYSIPWAPYVLWDIDLEGQALRDAYLAAIGGMDKNKPTIYCSKPLPPAVLPQLRSDGGSSPDENPDDGWGDFWSNEGSGDEPA